jgi:hypothetical protein
MSAFKRKHTFQAAHWLPLLMNCRVSDSEFRILTLLTGHIGIMPGFTKPPGRHKVTASATANRH